MTHLYIVRLKENSYYAIGYVNPNSIAEIEKLLHELYIKNIQMKENKFFKTFINETFKKFNIQLTPIEIDYVFRFK